MSTKSSIAYGKTFHFYHEIFDDRNVYLEIEGTHFEAGYNRVMVPIPIHIWEVIRYKGAPDLSLAPLSDSELEAMAIKWVDERIGEYEQSKDHKLAGILYFGTDRPRDVQLAEERERLRTSRKEQQEILAAIEDVRNYDPRKDAAGG